MSTIIFDEESTKAVTVYDLHDVTVNGSFVQNAETKKLHDFISYMGEICLCFCHGNVELGTTTGFDKIESVVLPDETKTIGNYAFYGCRDLKTSIFLIKSKQ